MSRIPTEKCGHTQWTGYEGYCVCVSCGRIINYSDIRLEANDDRLEAYINKVLTQSPDGQISFEVGVTPDGLVSDHSPNKIKFVVENRNGEAV